MLEKWIRYNDMLIILWYCLWHKDYTHPSAPSPISGQLRLGRHCSVLWLLLLSHLLHRLWQLCQCRAKPSTEGGTQGSKRRTGRGKKRRVFWVQSSMLQTSPRGVFSPSLFLVKVLYLLEKVLIFLPEALSQRWQYHRLSFTHFFLHHSQIILQYWSVDEQAASPGEQLEAVKARGNAPFPPLVRCTWRAGWRSGHYLIVQCIDNSFTTWHSITWTQVHAIFATLVPGFPSPYPNMGLTALAALTPEPGTSSFSIHLESFFFVVAFLCCEVSDCVIGIV